MTKSAAELFLLNKEQMQDFKYDLTFLNFCDIP